MYFVHRNSDLKYVMIMCRSINFVDATAIQTLVTLVESLKEEGITVIMVSLQAEIWNFVKKLPFYDTVGKENFFKRPNEALEDLNER